MNHEQRALLKSVQKVRGVLDRYPDGVSLSQITGDTQLSSAAARTALKHMGAELEDGLWFDVAEPEPELVEQSGNAGELEPEPVTIAESAPVEPVQMQLNKLTQSVFNGLPPEYRWATVDANGECWVATKEPERTDEYQWIFGNVTLETFKPVGGIFDAADWQNSLIERLSDTCIDDMGIANFQKERLRVADQQAKSDFAVALEAERQRVFDAVEFGGTAARIAERTGIPVDDVQMHLDTLIDDGAIVERPIVVAMSYKVAT